MFDRLILWPIFSVLLALFLAFWLAMGAWRLLARLLDRWSLGGL